MKLIPDIKEVETVAAALLSESIGKKAEIISTEPVGGGCIHHASKMVTTTGTFFLKWNRNCPADLFLREAEGLVELKKAAGDLLIIPEVITAKKVDNTPGFLVLEFLESAGHYAHSDEELGRGLAAIHRFTENRFGFHHDNHCGATPQKNSWKRIWSEFYRDNRLKFLLGLIKSERALDRDEEQTYEKLLDRIPGLLPESSVPVLIHGDLWSGNYMQTIKGPALIDPATCYADREMEWGMITLFGGFSARFTDSYHEVNPLPEGWRERNNLYRLYYLLNHYYLFGGGYRNQALQIARYYTG